MLICCSDGELIPISGVIGDLLPVDAELVTLRTLDRLNVYTLKHKEFIKEASVFLYFCDLFVPLDCHVRLLSAVWAPDCINRHVAT